MMNENGRGAEGRRMSPQTIQWKRRCLAATSALRPIGAPDMRRPAPGAVLQTRGAGLSHICPPPNGRTAPCAASDGQDRVAPSLVCTVGQRRQASAAQCWWGRRAERRGRPPPENPCCCSSCSCCCRRSGGPFRPGPATTVARCCQIVNPLTWGVVRSWGFEGNRTFSCCPRMCD